MLLLLQVYITIEAKTIVTKVFFDSLCNLIKVSFYYLFVLSIV